MVSGSEAADVTGPGERAAAGPSEAAAELSEQARQILDFERQWWRRAGAKEQAIRDNFGCSTTRYYQLLNRLLDDPAALAYDPITVTRLLRLRSWRHRGR